MVRRAAGMIGETRCPVCREINDRHTGYEDYGQGPQPGDYSVCMGCGALGIFTEDGVRLPTPEEEAVADADLDIRAARVLVRVAREMQRRLN
jgi:hypothetical protein